MILKANLSNFECLLTESNFSFKVLCDFPSFIALAQKHCR